MKDSDSKEIWKDIDSFEGRYKVSNKGRVYSVVSDLIMKQCVKVNSGYKYVHLSGSKNKSLYVHRLVAIKFVDNPKNYLEVNHVDGNKFNNVFLNLKWVTRQENIDHSWATGLLTDEIMANRKSNKGSNHGLSKLTESDIPQIRRLRNNGKTVKEISFLFNVSIRTIYDILSGNRWTHV